MENLLIILVALAVEIILFGGLGAYIAVQEVAGRPVRKSYAESQPHS